LFFRLLQQAVQIRAITNRGLADEDFLKESRGI
jgi:hypothetical protein